MLEDPGCVEKRGGGGPSFFFGPADAPGARGGRDDGENVAF